MPNDRHVEDRLENLVYSDSCRKWRSEVKSTISPTAMMAAPNESEAVLAPIDLLMMKISNMERVILAIKRESQAREQDARRAAWRGWWIMAGLAITAAVVVPRVIHLIS